MIDFAATWQVPIGPTMTRADFQQRLAELMQLPKVDGFLVAIAIDTEVPCECDVPGCPGYRVMREVRTAHNSADLENLADLSEHALALIAQEWEEKPRFNLGGCAAKTPPEMTACDQPAITLYGIVCAHGHADIKALCDAHRPKEGEVGCIRCVEEYGHDCPVYFAEAELTGAGDPPAVMFADPLEHQGDEGHGDAGQ